MTDINNAYVKVVLQDGSYYNGIIVGKSSAYMSIKIEDELIIKNQHMFKIGDKIDIPYGTPVQINLEEPFQGKIVGKSTTDITQQHLVKCSDGKYPNEIYPYDTISVPLHCIDILY